MKNSGLSYDSYVSYGLYMFFFILKVLSDFSPAKNESERLIFYDFNQISLLNRIS